ncbi:hypothetical protein LINGRAPRIM_LOCUS2578 [Linum grandiflorum]
MLMSPSSSSPAPARCTTFAAPPPRTLIYSSL